jgi:DNA-binding protein Fis
MTLDELVKGLCIKALKQSHSQRRAARLLGIAPNTLHTYLKKYNIENPYRRKQELDVNTSKM